ncbi:hypothetical protein V1527DRAFT_450274 [Lipomyces starkeyi]
MAALPQKRNLLMREYEEDEVSVNDEVQGWMSQTTESCDTNPLDCCKQRTQSSANCSHGKGFLGNSCIDSTVRERIFSERLPPTELDLERRPSRHRCVLRAGLGWAGLGWAGLGWAGGVDDGDSYSEDDVEAAVLVLDD